MSSTNIVRMPGSQMVKPALDLPGPRVWTPQNLADFLGVSVSWVHKRTMVKAEDPIPRIQGVGHLRFDTANLQFQEWMRKQLGHVDIEVGDE
jgi:hypothetical protein